MKDVQTLRDKRGKEQVTFDDVADHLEDFAGRNPEHTDVVGRLARFLAGVEDVQHCHEGGPPTIDPSARVSAEP